MTRRPRRRILRLQDRDEEILEFVLRYRMATREILQRKFFEDSELNAVTKVTSRLVDLGYLAGHPFVGTSKYFSLGLLGAKYFGIPNRCAEALGVQSLINQYGILEYCNVPGTRRSRFRVSELLQDHKALMQKGIDAANYVADSTKELRQLQFVRVDGGGTTDHNIRKLRQAISLRESNPMCKLLMETARFEVVCVTYSDMKADKLRLEVEKEKWPCAVHVFCTENLMPLLDL